MYILPEHVCACALRIIEHNHKLEEADIFRATIECHVNILYIEWPLFEWSEIQRWSRYNFSSRRGPRLLLMRSRPLSRASVSCPWSG